MTNYQHDAELELSADALGSVYGGAAAQVIPPHRPAVRPIEGADLTSLFPRVPVVAPSRPRSPYFDVHPDLEDPFPPRPEPDPAPDTDPKEPPIHPDLEDPFPPRPSPEFPFPGALQFARR